MLSTVKLLTLSLYTFFAKWQGVIKSTKFNFTK